MRLLLASMSLAFASLGLSAYPAPGAVSGNTSSVHDPTMCKDDSGTYYVFSSGVGIPIRTSSDGKNWTFSGVVFPDGAPWTSNYTGGKTNAPLWAPDCTYANGTFHLFYAASTSGSRDSAIFYANSTSGKPGKFINHNLVLKTIDKVDDYNAIDPNFLIDGSNWYLSFGSYWSGIKLARLNHDATLANTTYTALATRTQDNGSEEGSVVYKHGDHYYLFVSWGSCCNGTASTYNIRVGRSSSIEGPSVDQNGTDLRQGGGTAILQTHDNVHGPGGQDVMNDNGAVRLIYRTCSSLADPGNVSLYFLVAGSQDYYPSGRPHLGLNMLDFSSGWPVVT